MLLCDVLMCSCVNVLMCYCVNEGINLGGRAFWLGGICIVMC